MENFLYGAIIFTLFLCLNTNLSIAATHTDIAALVKFKNSIEKDAKGVLREWDSQHEACFWSGVSCTEWRVTGLDLSGSGLVGAIPLSAISSFDHLQTLSLSNNSLYGNLSTSPQFPFTLEKLDLSYNSLTGFISEEVFLHPNLESIYLSHNNFSGTLPRNLLSSDHIRELDLSSNNFTGFIKLDEFSSCESLTKLDLSANHFSGKIPSEISKCSHLKTLNISNNELINSIPKSFGQLESLEVLDISYNHLTGVLPQELGNSCSTLQELYVSTNNISGSFPLSFSACSSLSVLDISNNKISGDFPDSVLENLSSLENLLVSNNFFSGSFPLSVSSCSNIKIVDFSSNQLQGSLPDTICPGASALEELRLADNNITGTIPSTLSQCPALKTIDLSINRVSGIIPPELGSLKNLERLMMWFNQLEGPIPAELGKCRRLKDLILNNNDLSGSIPKTLSRCTEMEWIALSSNKLSGSIPRDFGNFKRLSILQLANNSLSGEIPREIGNCSSLLWLDLNNNKLTGTIPKRLGRQTGAQPLNGILSGNTLAFLRNVGNACQGVGGLLEFAGITPDRLLKVPVLKDCQFTRLYSGTALNDWTHYESLEYLDLSYNSLTGPIPDELGDMQAMQVLELAHNNLTGELPFSLGRLKNLGVFEASHNHLQGQIPQSFSNLTFLVQIDFSHNNLTGEIPERGQLSTLPASQYAGNPGLCGVPLPPCGASPASMGNPVADEPPRSKPAQFASLANSVVLGSMLAMAVACAVAVWVIATRARRREADAILKTLHTSCNTTTWKLGREKEPLSINVATFERPLRKLTFSQLIEATNGFCANSMVGSGGFGEVFKATLKDGSTVAIKKLIRLSCQGDREFMAEMETLGKIKHRNLVPLLGYCKVGEERLLVYEYMQYGSLDDMLHGEGETGKTKKSMLTWEVRKQIARGAAKGLAFLHHNCIPHIIHRDMKSSNVLLDRNMEARVSDFGMARLISALDTHLTISALAGTPGYVPPEYYQSIRCTAKGDVYSFGVMMLELVTGRRPTDKEAFGDSNLVGWARMHVSQGRASEIVDPAVKEEVGDVNGDVLKHLSIGLQCLEDFPSRRPNMLQVVSMFKELHAHFLPDGGAQLSLPTNVVVIN